MRRRFFIALIPILFTGIGAFAQATQPKPEDVACTVQGTVLAADSGKPLKSAQIRLSETDVKDKSPHVYRTSTDAEGKFAIKGVVPGRYRFVALKNGYVSQQYHPENSVSAALLTLLPAQKLDQVLFRMIPAAAVAGRITDEDGEPLSGIAVLALVRMKFSLQMVGATFGGKKQLFPVQRTVTNDLGEYRLYGLRPGKYYIAANDSGDYDPSFFGSETAWGANQSVRRYPPTFYPGTMQSSQADQVVLKPLDETRIDFSLQPAKLYEIKGKLDGSGGEPVSSAFVQLTQPDSIAGFFSIHDMATVDSDGGFTISGISPGTYEIIATSMERDRQLTAREKVEVTDRNLSSLRLVLTRGISISGRVITEGGQALPEPARQFVQFSNQTIDSGGSGSEQLKKDGTFTVSGLRPGSFRAQVYNLPEGCYVKSVHMGGQDFTDSEMKIDQSSAATSVEIRVANDAAQINGRVELNDKPVPGATVLLVREKDIEREPKPIAADQNGVFIVKSLRPGTYHLMAVQKAEDDWDMDYPEASEIEKNGQSVQVSSRETKSVTLRLTSKTNESTDDSEP